MTVPRIERPADIERMWAESETLTAMTLPRWLDLDDAGYYRRVTSDVPTGDERRHLEERGLVVDESGVYVEDPTEVQIFAIATAAGPSPLDLAVSAQPCLTRDDVTDVTAQFVADPFMLRRDSLWHMFVEVWDWHADKGAIGLATSADGLEWAYEQIVLAEQFHLSYPYVFEWEDEVYLVPESFQVGAVRLYRATRFPAEWECVSELVAGASFLDASPFHAAGRWWLLVGAGRHDELRLFAATDLVGPWREHPASPVVSGDPVRARPAGRVVVVGDRILRFAQRCDAAYGLDVRAFEVVELSTTRYSERELPGRVLGGSGWGWNRRGMHHVDPHELGTGSWVACVDGWRSATDADGTASTYS